MPSNLLDEFDHIALIEARMTVGEIVEILGMSIPELLECLPTGSVDALVEYLNDE